MATLSAPKANRETVNSMAAADKLAVHLEKTGLKLGKKVQRQLLEASEAGTLTEDFVKLLVGNEILEAAGGKTASLMWNFILSTVATPQNQAISFADPRTNYVWARARQIAQETVRTGKTEAARAQVGEALTNYVGYQVDDTQDKYTPAGRSKFRVWVRHTNAGACKWCVDQVDLYRNGGPWLRHGNCRCYKIPERRR